MGRRSKNEPSLAKFPRLRELRNELGWEVIDIATRLPGNRPSIASIYRLEQGQGLRVSNARRVFDLLNEALGGKLDLKKEIVMEKGRS
jgi:hypothetical protein